MNETGLRLMLCQIQNIAPLQLRHRYSSKRPEGNGVSGRDEISLLASSYYADDTLTASVSVTYIRYCVRFSLDTRFLDHQPSISTLEVYVFRESSVVQLVQPQYVRDAKRTKIPNHGRFETRKMEHYVFFKLKAACIDAAVHAL